MDKEGGETITREEAELIDSRITPTAYQKLLGLTQTLKFLQLVIKQQFCHTPMFIYNGLNGCVVKQENKAMRMKYEPSFQIIKGVMDHNRQAQQIQLLRGTPVEAYMLVNVCLLLPRATHSDKSDGYCVYYLVQDDRREAIFMYYHKILGKCVLIVTPEPGPVCLQVVTDFIISTTVRLPFHKDCSFCGRCAEDLTTCNGCKVARYCRKGCQVGHWPVHKEICRKRTAVLNLPVKPHPFFLWKGLKPS
jgi:hypothetical protein